MNQHELIKNEEQEDDKIIFYFHLLTIPCGSPTSYDGAAVVG